MSWLADNATTLTILFGLIAAALALIWRSNRQNKYLAYAGAALAMIAILWMVRYFHVSDARQLRLNVDAMATAVVDGKVDDLFQHISKDFVYEDGAAKMSRDQLYEAARGVIRRGEVGGINISRFKVEAVNRSDGKARVTFGVNPFNAAGDPLLPFDVEGHFVLEGERWKLKSVVFFRFNSKEKMGIPGL
jgi:hypothetical protein